MLLYELSFGSKSSFQLAVVVYKRIFVKVVEFIKKIFAQNYMPQLHCNYILSAIYGVEVELGN